MNHIHVEWSVSCMFHYNQLRYYSLLYAKWYLISYQVTEADNALSLLFVINNEVEFIYYTDVLYNNRSYLLSFTNYYSHLRINENEKWMNWLDVKVINLTIAIFPMLCRLSNTAGYVKE